MKQIKQLLAVFVLWAMIGVCQAAHPDEEFFSNEGSLSQMYEVSLQQAKQEEKLLLLIVGANWCHDSRALASQLQSDVVQEVIESNFVPLIVDAGWLTDMSELLTPLNHPVYFGTPSVFIVDPNHEIILNRASIQRWQSAHSESNSSLARYLTLQRQLANAQIEVILERQQAHQQKYVQIVEFEKQQAKRLYEAYAIMGPKLAHESSNGHDEELEALWEEIRRFRYQLQHDLVSLYQSLDSNVIRLPNYQRLSFE